MSDQATINAIAASEAAIHDLRDALEGWADIDRMELIALAALTACGPSAVVTRLAERAADYVENPDDAAIVTALLRFALAHPLPPPPAPTL